jgi:hypothetical protein
MQVSRGLQSIEVRRDAGLQVSGKTFGAYIPVRRDSFNGISDSHMLPARHIIGHNISGAFVNHPRVRKLLFGHTVHRHHSLLPGP